MIEWWALLIACPLSFLAGAWVNGARFLRAQARFEQQAIERRDENSRRLKPAVIDEVWHRPPSQ
jgi:hypothetical protein